MDNQGFGTALNGCTNYNSISIEMCWNKDTDTVVFNTIELVKELLRQYPNARVCRHWDVSRKDCPHGFTGPNNAKWNWFLEEIKKPRKMILDLSKDSEGKMVDDVQISTPQAKKEGGYSVLTNTPNDVLNVRENPSATSKLKSSYRHGSKIYVHDVIKNSEGTWYKIEYKKGIFGYVSAKYCKGI